MIYKKITINKDDNNLSNEKTVLNYLLKNGYPNIKKASLKDEGKGVPDFVYEENGVKKYIEVKTEGSKLTASQNKWINNHKHCDVTILIADIRQPDGKKLKIVSVKLNSKQMSYFGGYIDISKWIGGIINKAILLRDKNKEVIKILQDEIDESN